MTDNEYTAPPAGLPRPVSFITGNEMPRRSPESCGWTVTTTGGDLLRPKPAKWNLWCWLTGHLYTEHYEPPFDPSYVCFRCRRTEYDASKLRPKDETNHDRVTIQLSRRNKLTLTPGDRAALDGPLTAAQIRAFLYGGEPTHGVHRR